MTDHHFDRDRLVAAAIDRAGCGDFGEPTWQEGLDVLLASMADEGRFNELGRDIASGDVVQALVNRLQIIEWRRRHPDVAGGPIAQPIFIVGQPRTGTTILHDLLALDPELRAPLTWEVDRPVPPPATETFDTDPRIAEIDETLAMSNSLIPGFTDFHPMGARLAQECVRITASTFRSMIFPVQFRVPTYNRWLLHEADLAPAYRWHRIHLQHLQSAHPAPQWLLKSPAHLWHVGALFAEYPDAVIVQTHRDPLKVLASISALTAHLRRMCSDDADIDLGEIAESYVDDIFVGLERGLAARADGTVPPDRVVDVQFRSFIADPIAAVRRVYEALGRELDPATETSMRTFLVEHPGDGGGSGTRYRFSDTGLDEIELRERAAAYQDRFGVESEPLT